MIEIFNQIFKQLGYENQTKIIKSDNADYQCDDLFKLAKTYHKSPLTIGQEFIKKINTIPNFQNYFKEVSLAKPGFINITVSDEYINRKLNILKNQEKFAIKEDNKTIVIDYGGPNIAKPLHVGHLRSAIIGQAINNILKFQGNKTISDIHLGDSGLQMGQVIYGILEDFPNTKIEDIKIDIEYLNKTYPKISMLCKENKEVKEVCALITKQLQEGHKEYNILSKKIKEVSIKDMKKIYDYLQVDFDYWKGEMDSIKEYPEMFKYLKQQNILKIDDGALVIDVKEENDKINIPPCIVQKSNGAYLYTTSDIGTIFQRKRDFNPNEIIYITDDRQKIHFIQVFRAVKKAKIFNNKLVHYGFGTVNNTENKPFKTRTGDALKLEDLIKKVTEEFISLRTENENMETKNLKKIVNAIIKFADLENDLEKNYIFDIKKFSKVNGKTGPYILYTYLRINKIIKENKNELSNNIYNDIDKKLRLKLLEVTEVLNKAINTRKPHYIANYLYELSVLANNFYEHNHLSNLTGKQKDDFEIILNLNNKIIKQLLNLLGIQIPTKM